MESMNAVRIHGRGGPQAVVYERAPKPAPAPDDVLARVHAAAISPGEFSWGYDWNKPVIPCHEVSGVVAATGATVSALKVGDAVFGLVDFARDGAAAQYVAVRAGDLALKPHSVDHTQAAAMALSALTAWQALRVHAALRAGQRVLIHGGAGGVGSFAVQIAKWLGAEAIATASANNAAFVKDLGADLVIDYTQGKFEDQLTGVDVVFDTVGGDVQQRSLKVLKRGGVLVSIAEKPADNWSAGLGIRAIYFIVEPDRGQLAQLARFAGEGVLKPVVSRIFPLAQAREAYELGLRGHLRGKIVLRVD